MMTREFDPYHRWLAIPPEEQPPNHYRLLGLPLFENDADVIESAADRQMAHLRTFQAGPNGDLSQKVLNEVAAAKICLLDSPRKTAYDEGLRRALEPSVEAPQQSGQAEHVAPDLLSVLTSIDAGKPSVAQRARSKSSFVALGTTAVVVLLLGGLLFWMLDLTPDKPVPSKGTANTRAEASLAAESTPSKPPVQEASRKPIALAPIPKELPEPSESPELRPSPPQAVPAELSQIPTPPITADPAPPDLGLKDIDSIPVGEVRRYSFPGTVAAIAALPDGRGFLVTGWGGRVVWYDLATGTVLLNEKKEELILYGIAVSPDGRRAVCGGRDRIVRVLDLESKTWDEVPVPGDTWLMAPAFFQDSRHVLYSTFRQPGPRVFDLDNRREILNFAGPQWTDGLAMSHRARKAITGSTDQTVRILDLAGGKEINRLRGHTSHVRSVAISPDGRWGLSGADDKTVRIWDLHSGEERHCLDAPGSAYGVAFLGDGRYAVTTGGTLRLWDVDSGMPIAEYKVSTNRICPLPDNRFILCGAGGTVLLWRLPLTKSGQVFRGETESSGEVEPAPQSSQSSEAVAASEQTPEAGLTHRETPDVPTATDHLRTDASGPQQPQDSRPERAPIPSSAVQEKILKEVTEVYRLAEAKTSEQKIGRARELMEAAEKYGNAPDERFVLLRRAMELASEGGDVALLLHAVDRIAADFEIDALTVKQNVLTKFASDTDHAARITSFLENVDGVIREALDEERYELALDLVTTALRSCQKSAGRPFRKQMHDRREQIQHLYGDWRQVQQAKGELKANPDDAEANLVLGRWYGLIKEDWRQGLPYLAKGSNEGLKVLAHQELIAPPAEPEGQVKLADAWWDLSQAADAEAKEALARRAGHWYQQALPSLSGLTKARVDNRLAEIKLSNADTASTAPVGLDSGTVPGPKQDQADDVTKLPGKVIPETIDREIRLARKDGPYKLVGRVTITPQGALLLERGTTVLAAPGAAILANGQLNSYGESDDFVRFRPGLPQAGWDKLSLQSGVKHVVERFDVRGAQRGLYVAEDVDAEIKDCLFLQNKVGVETRRNYKFTLWFRNCLIANNVSDGITFYLNRVSLDHCTIASNGGVGLNMTYYGNLTVVSCNLTNNAVGLKSNLYEGHVNMKSSNLVNHLTAAIEVRTPQDFQCQGNYWGTDNPQQIALSIIDGLKKPGRGVVVFKDFEKKPILDAGCSLKVPKER
ncbi:MAG: right-handed parallel beta-helix repeat-containing protein [Thermoguttaceae bacterium]|jgi:WD40 repeat protein|nr:right-handed parallel beta-helix repeat-containing protein [Thermoguttaceae bacterium]